MKTVTARLLTLIPLFFVIGAGRAGAGPPPLKVLLIDGQSDHDWRRTTPVLQQILEGTGRFAVTVATTPAAGSDMSDFHPEFAQFDAVMSNYNGDEWPESTKRDFVNYIAAGGGFVSIHAANRAFADWDSYRQIIGLGDWGRMMRPDGPYVRWRNSEQRFARDWSHGLAKLSSTKRPFTIEVRDPTHPITRGLPLAFVQTADELSTHLRGPAQNIHVLATALSGAASGGSGNHEPVLFTVQYGEGRVFQTTLGDDVTAMHGVAFQETLQRGVEWAATGEVLFPPLTEQDLGISTAYLKDPADIVPDPDLDPPQPRGSGWSRLFNGKDLRGWVQRNGTASFHVVDGAIVGQTAEGSPNSFLCTADEFRDFELTFEVKCDAGLNSGVQIRSASRTDYKNGRVHGPQIEIEHSPGESGYIYSEGTARGWTTKAQPVKNAYINGEWNRYLVRARGDRLQTWVNGRPVADARDRASNKKGFIGLQVHEIERDQGPFEVRWRDIRVRRLDPQP